MSAAKHTLGPWSIPHFAENASGAGCQCAHVLCEGYAGSICDISIDNEKKIGEGGNDSPPIEEARANARLIAAAPELLDALKDMVPMIGVPISGEHYEECTARIRYAISVIAKAEGLL